MGHTRKNGDKTGRVGDKRREARQGREEKGKRGISPPRSFLKVGDYVQH